MVLSMNPFLLFIDQHWLPMLYSGKLLRFNFYLISVSNVHLLNSCPLRGKHLLSKQNLNRMWIWKTFSIVLVGYESCNRRRWQSWSSLYSCRVFAICNISKTGRTTDPFFFLHNTVDVDCWHSEKDTFMLLNNFYLFKNRKGLWRETENCENILLDNRSPKA